MPATATETEDQIVITATEPAIGLIAAGKHLPGSLVEKSPGLNSESSILVTSPVVNHECRFVLLCGQNAH
jgi:hypothetical protein